jgi:hypothetical protein
VALNQLINVAVAEKVSPLGTESFIMEPGARANVPKALRILKGLWHRTLTNKRRRVVPIDTYKAIAFSSTRTAAVPGVRLRKRHHKKA